MTRPAGRPGPKPRLKEPRHFSVTLPAALIERLDAEADRRHVSRAEVVRQAVERYLGEGPARRLAEAEKVSAEEGRDAKP